MVALGDTAIDRGQALVLLCGQERIAGAAQAADGRVHSHLREESRTAQIEAQLNQGHCTGRQQSHGHWQQQGQQAERRLEAERDDEGLSFEYHSTARADEWQR